MYLKIGNFTGKKIQNFFKNKTIWLKHGYKIWHKKGYENEIFLCQKGKK